MNANRRVLLFVVFATGIYLLASVLAAALDWKWMPARRVNLISDITPKYPPDDFDETDSLSNTDTSSLQTITIPLKDKISDFDLYQTGHLITNFNVDTNAVALERFIKKLYDLKHGKKQKIRIAYFGDSMIEGDLLTQTLRKLLQQIFGGSGVGFVPITSQVSQFRTTVTDNYSGGWQDENFKTDGDKSRLYISGHTFRSNGDWVQMKDRTVKDTAAIIEKSLLCGYLSHPANITVNNLPVTIHADNLFNRIVLDKSRNTSLKLSVAEAQLPVYGISFESESGIILDNFSFRGITGIEFARIDSSFLRSIAAENPYDLIIFQYGVNLLFRPYDKNFSWYARTLMPIIKKIKNCFPESDFLLVSTADRAFRYGDQYRSAVGIDSLVKAQALLAYETGSSFYNQFESMGGTNSIVQWASQNPSLANKDYVHPNFRGAEILGQYFFQAIMNDYEKFTRTKK
jgi:lysophospholipase L1-like esterase